MTQPEYSLLALIDHPKQLRALTKEQLPALAAEVRSYMLDVLATREGHIGASLGAVELTLALHYAFDTPRDRLVWDVGHQTYAHKIITGRREAFANLRCSGGLSGFPKPDESPFDAFGAGHSSTALSAAAGMAAAYGASGNSDIQCIAVVGDAALASGLSFEALNHIGQTQWPIWLVLNDNGMSIDPSVGALAQVLARTQHDQPHAFQQWLTPLGYRCSEPIDGHDIAAILAQIELLKKWPGPKCIHLKTQKGKGFPGNQADPWCHHAPGPFDRQTGKSTTAIDIKQPLKYQDVFGLTLLDLAKKNNNIYGVTPAMPTGSSLHYMMQAFPERTFDVGIAEPHAVTFAAGLAMTGKKVYCAIYSTFLQRAYDSIIHDVALQRLPVVFCIDRAGFVGEDGPTHHGLFDIAYLNAIPGFTLWAPKDERELQLMLHQAQFHQHGPIAIRYPRGRGNLPQWKEQHFGQYAPFDATTPQVINDIKSVNILSTGTIAKEVHLALSKEIQAEVGWIHLPQIKPLPLAFLERLAQESKIWITVEEGTIQGGFGQTIAAWTQAQSLGVKVEVIGVPDTWMPHGPVNELKKQCQLDALGIQRHVNKILQQEK